MTIRQEKILKILIEEYIQSAKSVASGFLSHKLSEKTSSATIRNELSALEDLGYLVQPHTSAGRIPTAKAYNFYVDKYVKDKLVEAQDQQQIVQALKNAKDKSQALKNLAKKLAEISDQAVILAFAKNDIYYTGLSNLFSKPEFADKNLIVDVSRVIDHLDVIIHGLFDKVNKTEIKISENCRFSKYCSAVIGKHKNFLIAILGPVRMDYQKNFSLINFITSIK